jgi:Protein of unknown function (DUF664)
VGGRRRDTLDAVGVVPWWGNAEVTLHRVILHVTVDTQRHAGHADIVRELIDGATGLLPGTGALPERDEAGWVERRNLVEQAAIAAAGA